MPAYSQSNSPLAVTTPLGEDLLLLIGFRGHEAVSQLFVSASTCSQNRKAKSSSMA